ncbi:MAG: DNA translocase FtsK [Clostridiales bacterium]|nr:DNA translocase FtsK [Clostridiales bacterium]
MHAFKINLLKANTDNGSNAKTYRNQVVEGAKKLEETLGNFGVSAKVINVTRGPSVTRYELQPSAGVKVSRIVSLSDDISLNLAASGVRIEAPIPGKAAIGIEVPNKDVNMVTLREVLESDEFEKHPSKISFAIGKDISGESIVADIAKMPHLLIAGATGSGKSVCINSLITSILYKASPEEVKLLMVDPKVVELGVYNGIPHLLIPVVTEPKKAAGALNWAVQEMVNRYKLFADKSVRDLSGYNDLMKRNGEQTCLPQIIIIIDELADLMMVAPNDVEDAICRLAQMARAAGMHLVIATQRPSVNVITGVIKANIPSRISFAVTSQIDSRTILDMGGAEKLLGRGDMLFHPVGRQKPIRIQGANITDIEVEKVVEFVKAQGNAEYDETIIEEINSEETPTENNDGDNDELLPKAIELVVEAGQASVSLIQRKFKVGYARAARIVDQMEARGIVGGYEGSKPRQILISRQEWHELQMSQKQ